MMERQAMSLFLLCAFPPCRTVAIPFIAAVLVITSGARPAGGTCHTMGRDRTRIPGREVKANRMEATRGPGYPMVCAQSSIGQAVGNDGPPPHSVHVFD